ncbi:ATP-dependent RNA helicase DDX54 isoform X1 [Achroia grisella]|uniref:ATP-dependent RNA helicase DDX54 isoform X1 n=1 Tax=Achroia grisella TaxID=688607 RepID=UPI0027D2FF34|nr:ATP-dependent RNA helicase DDX54 isoform X1 [Achroia grisella]
MLKPKKLGDDLPGFEVPSGEGDTQNEQSNIKKKKKSSGGFQSMGLSFHVIKGITKRGYKQPTPIQRKTIPLALEGKDVVAMARTGSGKTACFVLPILDKLIAPANKPLPGKNFRALILSPTRELALQTLRFVRELGKFTGLTSAAILGGESIEQQFSVMSGKSPDIVVATPGRFLHICIEMSLKLDNINVVVFDEADRLFELGFGEQLREIVARLPSNRQTLLFSATLPKMLVEFARAGLSDPVLIRLDVDWKLPSTLWLGWLYVRAELKTAALLLLLDRVLTPQTPQAVVFAATKHHVEYLNLILQRAGISSTYAYSGLDPSARKIALGRFTNKKCSVLLVTDVAARGLDLPALDTVINYNFPATPKLFVHRVGRSARAGRAGRAWSLLAAADLAHLLDLQLFLGAELLSPAQVTEKGLTCPSGVWGIMPTSQLELRHQDVMSWERNYSEIEEAARTCSRGLQQYVKWREAASAEANKRAKTITPPALTHPFLLEDSGDDANKLVEQIKNYTPKGTILELAAKNDSPMYLAMKAKKHAHGKMVQKTRDNKKLLAEGILVENIEPNRKKKKEVIRDENYIPHQASDQHTEAGMAVNFNVGAAAAELQLGADCGQAARAARSQLRWDRKRKKMVHVDPDGGRKMIRTESGGRVPASFRSGRYDDWRRRNAAPDADGDDDDAPAQANRKKPVSEFRPHWVKHNERVAKKKSEASSKEFSDKHKIVKERLRREKIKQKLKHKMKGKKKKKK